MFILGDMEEGSEMVPSLLCRCEESLQQCTYAKAVSLCQTYRHTALYKPNVRLYILVKRRALYESGDFRIV